jgi:pimeloyl-ACP methyl ester carboxylesterase
MYTVTSSDGTSIACEQVGTGPAIVIVAGVFNLRSIGSDLAAELASDHTVVTYDRRARGDSTDTRPYAIEREVDDLDAVIASVGGRAAVFGFSSGAILALKAAADGSPISRLFLYEPPFSFSSGQHVPPADLPAILQAMLDDGRPGDVVATHQLQGIGLPKAMVDGLRHSPIWAGLEAMAQSVVYDATITCTFQTPTTAMTRISVPTAVLHGVDTWPALAESAARLGDLMTTARVVAVPGGANHTIPPAATAAAIRTFENEE